MKLYKLYFVVYIYNMKYLTFFFCCLAHIIYGQTWQSTSITPNINGQRFDDVFFLNDNLGWVANGFYAAVFKTTDGGLTWTEQVNSADLGGGYYFTENVVLDANLMIAFLNTIKGPTAFGPGGAVVTGSNASIAMGQYSLGATLGMKF